MRFVCLVTLSIVVLPSLVASEPVAPIDLTTLPREHRSWHEDFEKRDPVELWESTGAITVRFKGLTSETAAGGTKSFKLDIDLNEDGESYWRIPLGVPLEGDMQQDVHWRVGRHCDAEEVGVGYAVFFTPTDQVYRRAVCTVRGETLKGRDSGWRLCRDSFKVPGWPKDSIVSECRAGSMGTHIAGVGKYDVGVETDPILWIKGRAGQRAVVYLDEVLVEGDAPERSFYRKAVARRYNAAAVPLHNRFQHWRKRYVNALSGIAGLEASPEWLVPYRTALEQETRRQQRRLAAVIDDGYAGWKELDPIIDTLWAAEHSIEGLRSLGTHDSAPALVHFRLRPIANTPYFPDGIPTVGAIGRGLELAACRGEYEPASFAVHARSDIEGLTLTISDLKGPGTIPSSAVDPFVVKIWYRAGVYAGDPHGRFLLPHLLLKDDDLVRVDTKARHNYVRHTAEDGAEEYRLCSGPTSDNLAGVRPVDAKTLQPVSVPAGTTKAFWLTALIPEDASAGNYTGTVSLQWDGGGSHTIPIHLKVHAFELPVSPVIYSVFNRGRVSDETDPNDVNSEYLSVEQYEREIRNQVAHGILYPNSYDGGLTLKAALEARRRAGVATDRFFSVDLAYHVYVAAQKGTEEGFESLKQRIAKWQSVLKEYGYGELYVMSKDEARGHLLTAQRPAMEAIHEAGAKVWAAATHESTFGYIGDLLDLAVMAGLSKPSEEKQWHAAGKEIFGYGAPQTDWDQPEIFRRNQGLGLWKIGYDGYMHYAYRHGMGHVWNDFDHERRDHTFVYPTIDGLIDTIGWEGVREGIDDTRYAAALLTAIEEATIRFPVSPHARSYVKGINIYTAMDEVRASIVAWIEKLQ